MTSYFRRAALALCLVPVACSAQPPRVASVASVAAASDATVGRFADEMQTRHGFDPAWVADLLADAVVERSILDAIARPAEKAKPWHEYRKIFVNDTRVERGAAFWREHADTLERVAADCGVPVEMLVAILGVETNYGRLTGRYRVLDSLNTLAFHYPPRSRFFRSELEQFLLLARERDIDPRAALGSYAGAMGAPQFISSSYRRYAVDGDGDGRVDLWDSWPDVIASVANYFRTHGWRPGQPVVARAQLDDPATAPVRDSTALSDSVKSLRSAGVRFDATVPADTAAMLFALDGADGNEYWVGYQNFYTITRYNRSRMYALAAHQLGEAIAARVRDDG